MITLKYIRLYFDASFNSIFCIRMKYFKKQKIGLLHLALTNLFSLSQKKNVFFNGIRVNNVNISCLITLYNIRLILYYIFLFHISSTLPFTEMFTFCSKIQQTCSAISREMFENIISIVKNNKRFLKYSPQLRMMFCSTHLKLPAFLHYLAIL